MRIDQLLNVYKYSVWLLFVLMTVGQSWVWDSRAAGTKRREWGEGESLEK